VRGHSLELLHGPPSPRPFRHTLLRPGSRYHGCHVIAMQRQYSLACGGLLDGTPRPPHSPLGKPFSDPSAPWRSSCKNGEEPQNAHKRRKARHTRAAHARAGRGGHRGSNKTPHHLSDKPTGARRRGIKRARTAGTSTGVCFAWSKFERQSTGLSRRRKSRGVCAQKRGRQNKAWDVSCAFVKLRDYVSHG
jgi:hypothetical protein